MVEVLHAVTSVRAVLVNGLSSGLRNDAPDRAIAMRQKCVGVGPAWQGESGGCMSLLLCMHCFLKAVDVCLADCQWPG
jgi:hypothetical protein